MRVATAFMLAHAIDMQANNQTSDPSFVDYTRKRIGNGSPGHLPTFTSDGDKPSCCKEIMMQRESIKRIHQRRLPYPGRHGGIRGVVL